MSANEVTIMMYDGDNDTWGDAPAPGKVGFEVMCDGISSGIVWAQKACNNRTPALEKAKQILQQRMQEAQQPKPAKASSQAEKKPRQRRVKETFYPAPGEKFRPQDGDK